MTVTPISFILFEKISCRKLVAVKLPALLEEVVGLT